MTDYTDQSSGAIRLYLLRGDFDMAQLTVLEHKTFTHEDFHIGIGILGESHFVRFKKDEEVINEICACTDARIDDTKNLIIHDFLPNLHTLPVTATFSGRQYSFSFTYENWETGSEQLNKLRHNMSDMHALSLKHVFPPHDVIQEEAITEIYAVLTDKIIIRTVHTYPNEHMMVFTATTLQKNP